MATSNLAQLLRQRIAANNPIETAARHFAGDIKDQVAPAKNDIKNQLLGGEALKSKGPTEMKAGQEFSLSKAKSSENTHKAPEAKPSRAAAAIEYFAEMRRVSERSNSRENVERKQQIDRLLAEVARLAKSSKIVEQKFAAFTVDQGVSKPGKYHTNFLEWMIFVISDARRKVEDAGAWLSSMNSKKGKRGGKVIQDAWKKGNTSVTMSNERSSVTQTG